MQGLKNDAFTQMVNIDKSHWKSPDCIGQKGQTASTCALARQLSLYLDGLLASSDWDLVKQGPLNGHEKEWQKLKEYRSMSHEVQRKALAMALFTDRLISVPSLPVCQSN